MVMNGPGDRSGRVAPRRPPARGPVSSRAFAALDGEAVQAAEVNEYDVLDDADVQLALWCLYELAYRGFEDVDPDAEWWPAVVAFRRSLEQPFERAVRRAVRDRLADIPQGMPVASAIFALVEQDSSPSLAAFLHRQASRSEMLDFLRQRSIYHLKESDPHSFVLPRLDGPPKAALAELQYDEYGAGRPERLHATLFADALDACGLDRTYGAYLDEATAPTLAVNNVMSLFALNRRLRGAALGHLAVFEATSSLPSRKIATGVRRLGLPEAVALYYDEHVEADAVHEQLAARGVCQTLVDAEPQLREDVLLGAATCLELDGRAALAQLAQWGRADIGASA